jgi:hypothetical protein
MKKNELQELVQECISEVLDERKSKGDDEFKRVDKGIKGKVAKDKGEEEVYGAGYVAGEKAAKAKYKKLAEAYKALSSKKPLNEDIFDDIEGDLMEGGFESQEAQIEYLKEVINYCQSKINEIESNLDEARFKKGEDVGEPGPGFAKIEKSAEKRYGSEEAGKRVAGAILKKVLAKKK